MPTPCSTELREVMAPSGLLSFLWPDRINNPLVGVKDPEARLTHTLIGVKTPVIGVKNLHASRHIVPKGKLAFQDMLYIA